MAELRIDPTCEACPEQYDIIVDDEQLAYVRLRWGHLQVFAPNYDIEHRNVIMEYMWHDEPYKGAFDDDTERRKFMEQILGTVHDYYQWIVNGDPITMELLP